MAIHHLTTNIAGLLRNYNEKRLGELFQMDGQEAKKELESLINKGDRLLPSEGCKDFDAQMGCRFRYYNEDGSLIITPE